MEKNISTRQRAYQTGHEIEFIRHLGLQQVEATAGMTRAELLRQYLDSCRNRVVWDGIDAAAVIAFAEGELTKELLSGEKHAA